MQSLDIPEQGQKQREDWMGLGRCGRQVAISDWDTNTGSKPMMSRMMGVGRACGRGGYQSEDHLGVPVRGGAGLGPKGSQC